MTNLVQMLGGYQCLNCQDWRTPSHIEGVTIGDETFHVCEDCTEAMSYPGKYEGVAEEKRALVLVLESIALDFGADNSLTDEWDGSADVIDRWLLRCDHYGFVSVQEFASPDKAQAELDSLERDGFGASEYDGWIADDRNGYSVSLEGKHIGTYPRLNRARAALAIACRDSGYWPNLWRQGERGGNTLMLDIPYLEERGAIAPPQSVLDHQSAEKSAA